MRKWEIWFKYGGNKNVLDRINYRTNSRSKYKLDIICLYNCRKVIAIVKDEEIQRIGYYAVILATVLFNERLKPNEKLLYALITALSNKEGYCYASNKYLGEKLGVDPVTVSRWITDLRRNNYVFVDIMRNEKKEIICRRIFPNDVPYRLNNQYPYILKDQEGNYKSWRVGSKKK